MGINWRSSIGRNHKLGVRLVSVSLAGLLFGLSMVMGTLWLSWALEGAAAAINDTGSLRMQSVRIALNLNRPDANADQLRKHADALTQTLTNLTQGDPQRPLRMPNSQPVQHQFDRVAATWHNELLPLIRATLAEPGRRTEGAATYTALLTGFVEQADNLASLIELENARDTAFLRGSQLALIVLMLVGCVATIYLLYGWVIRPVEALQRGITVMSSGNFDVQVPVEGRDEFGELATGFNNMAAELKALYGHLENRVQQKTLELATQNRALSTLYQLSAYLSQPGELEQRCKGFLSRLVEHFEADGGTVRILDPRQNNLHLTVHQGLSPDFVKQEQCVHAGDCLCGEASQKGITTLHDFRKSRPDVHYLCQEEGFNSIAIAQINNSGVQLGSYTLHFRTPRQFSDEDRRLFDSFGQHLGVAIENQRLLARTRELAVAEERNLVAQGLHDSIAQGLNFLKLQVQMLQDSLRRNATHEVQEVMELIETGLRESYEDVRELLMNFRIKLDEGDLVDALNNSAERFERQTKIPVTVDVENQGAPLPAEQQLQLLFIVQEALSNIRKHARACHVHIHLANSEDFVLDVTDDGCGFDPERMDDRPERPVGLHIMQERATRLGAHLDVVSTPGLGTRISLRLEHVARTTA